MAKDVRPMPCCKKGRLHEATGTARVPLVASCSVTTGGQEEQHSDRPDAPSKRVKRRGLGSHAPLIVGRVSLQLYLLAGGFRRCDGHYL